MDDYSITSLTESKNEWCIRLLNLVTPCVVDGLKSIFKEAWLLCKENGEESKYLMTFQNFLSRIPKWNPEIIDQEKARIMKNSSCDYLDDLITCVHIVQLKALTCVRVGQKQKQIDIDVPSINDFIHKIYINVARKVYQNIYLFEKDIPALQIQKNNRELELIIKECILNTIRDSIPVETILKNYLDETNEQNVEVEETVIEENVPQETASEETVPEETVPEDSNPNESSPEIEVSTTEDVPIEKPTIAGIVIKKTSHESSKHEEPVVEEPIVEEPIVEEPSIVHKVDTETINVNTENTEQENTKLKFSDVDNAIDTMGNKENIEAPKTIERLEKISIENDIKRKLEEDEDEEDALEIGNDIELDFQDVNDLTKKPIINSDIILSDVEVLS